MNLLVPVVTEPNPENAADFVLSNELVLAGNLLAWELVYWRDALHKHKIWRTDRWIAVRSNAFVLADLDSVTPAIQVVLNQFAGAGTPSPVSEDGTRCVRRDFTV